MRVMGRLFCFLFALAVIPYPQRVTGVACGPVSGQDKLNCGWRGIRQHECEVERGCCWDTSDVFSPPCFGPGLSKPPGERCILDRASRKECGWCGMTQVLCESKGCCWHPLAEGGPWCFHAEPQEAPVADQSVTYVDSPLRHEYVIVANATTVTCSGQTELCVADGGMARNVNYTWT